MFSSSNNSKQLFGSKRPSPLDVVRGGSKSDILTGKGGAIKGEIHNRSQKGECQRECSVLGDRLIK